MNLTFLIFKEFMTSNKTNIDIISALLSSNINLTADSNP